MSESALQAQVVHALKKMGVWVVRIGVNRSRRGVAKSGEPGMPDLWTPWGWIEVKHGEKSKLSDEQIDWHARAIGLGVNVGVARSVGDAVRLVTSWRKQKGRAA